VGGCREVWGGVVGLLIVDLIVLQLEVVLVILFAGASFASVANFAEGVVEVVTVEASPIRTALRFVAVLIFHLPHASQYN
jgi:hypothetical protein